MFKFIYNNLGVVDVFSHTTAWAPRATLTPWWSGSVAFYGQCVAQSPDGSTQAVGVPDDGTSPIGVTVNPFTHFDHDGSVYVYRGGF